MRVVCIALGVLSGQRCALMTTSGLPLVCSYRSVRSLKERWHTTASTMLQYPVRLAILFCTHIMGRTVARSCMHDRICGSCRWHGQDPGNRCWHVPRARKLVLRERCLQHHVAGPAQRLWNVKSSAKELTGNNQSVPSYAGGNIRFAPELRYGKLLFLKRQATPSPHVLSNHPVESMLRSVTLCMHSAPSPSLRTHYVRM